MNTVALPTDDISRLRAVKAWAAANGVDWRPWWHAVKLPPYLAHVPPKK